MPNDHSNIKEQATRKSPVSFLKRVQIQVIQILTRASQWLSQAIISLRDLIQYIPKMFYRNRAQQEPSEIQQPIVSQPDAIRQQSAPVVLQQSSGVISRTQVAKERNSDISQEGQDFFIQINGQKYPMVSQTTRNFNQKIYSVGSTEGREYIELDPNSKQLNELYANLRKEISKQNPPLSIIDMLKKIAEVTKSLFEIRDEKRLHAFIQDQLRSSNPVVSLDSFITNRIGVCRHHTLLNAYFLSRLSQDQLIKGEVIHHRQDIVGGAHTWNIFIDHKNEPTKVYSLDSLWNEIYCITDNPGCLKHYYGAEDEIMKRYVTDARQTEAALIWDFYRHAHRHAPRSSVPEPEQPGTNGVRPN